MSNPLLIATRNTHKLEELAELFAPFNLQVQGLDAFPDLPDVEEDGKTFEANAVKKAVEIARLTGRITLADDSGLEVDALGGAPGIYSARYAGTHGEDAANNRKLLEELEGIEDRRARFVCALALAWPDGKSVALRGTCEGSIGLAPEGQEGFGYDPLFLPAGETQSFAALGSEVKQRISHRAQALRLALETWGAILAQRP